MQQEHVLAYLNYSSKTCGLEALTSTTILKKCSGKVAREGRKATS